MELNDYRNFFFDLDRTLWNWDTTLIGAGDLIDTLNDAGKNVYFHTDNTLLSRKAYAEKLSSMGIRTNKENILTSGYVAAEILSKENINHPYFKVLQPMVQFFFFHSTSYIFHQDNQQL